MAYVVEGYMARYVSNRARISVSATTFDDPSLATAGAVLVGLNDRFVTGATVIDVAATRTTDCFSAIHVHIRSLL